MDEEDDEESSEGKEELADEKVKDLVDEEMEEMLPEDKKEELAEEKDKHLLEENNEEQIANRIEDTVVTNLQQKINVENGDDVVVVEGIEDINDKLEQEVLQEEKYTRGVDELHYKISKVKESTNFVQWG